MPRLRLHLAVMNSSSLMFSRFRHWLALSAFMITSPNVLHAQQTGIFTSSRTQSPVVGLTSFEGTNQTTFVASDDPYERGGVLTTDGNYVFCARPGLFRRTSLTNNVSETSPIPKTAQFDPVAITTDGHHLIVAEYKQSKFIEYSMDFKSPRVIAPSTRYVTSIVTDGIFIYWSDEELGIFRMKMNGTQVVKLLDERNVFGLSASSTHLYYRSDVPVQCVRRCGLDGGDPETLVDLVAVFGPGNYYTNALTVTETHVYWLLTSGYNTAAGTYRCELNGANPVRLTTYNNVEAGSIVAYPNALFPEPMAPVTPRLDYDQAAASVELFWQALPDRRYRIRKSTDLLNFSTEMESFDPQGTTAGLTLESPEPSAFFLVEKLPGKTAP
jgi:hypothetical protein